MKRADRWYQSAPPLARGGKKNPFGIQQALLDIDRAARETVLPRDAIEHYGRAVTYSPVVRACRDILISEATGGELRVMRAGQPVKLTPAFHAFLCQHWVQCAKDLVEGALATGFACAAIVEVDPPAGAVKASPRPLAPMIVSNSLLNIAFHYNDGFRRIYTAEVRPGAVAAPTGAQPQVAGVFVHTHPDEDGQLRSPTAAVEHLLEFEARLVQFATRAEAVRTRPWLVTESMPRSGPNALDSGSLFFDSEARSMDAQSNSELDAWRVAALRQNLELCKEINNMQTMGSAVGPPGPTNPTPDGASTLTDPDVTPCLYAVPKV